LESGGIAPSILDLGTRWRWVVSFTHRPLFPQGKNPSYPLDRRLGGTQSRSGRGGEEKNSQPLQGLEPPIIQPVAQRYTSELSRLLEDETVYYIKFPYVFLLKECKLIRHLRFVLTYMNPVDKLSAQRVNLHN
jgi:hypothetical protein